MKIGESNNISASYISVSQVKKEQTEDIKSQDTDPTASEKGVTAKKDATFDASLNKLKTADAQVRAHEAAHLAAGGGVVTGGASFSYERGSDGKMYAVGGEVPIDASEGNTPEATIQKARRIVAAAMAPADPSPQDYRVAATAMMMEVQARTEQMRELQNQINGNAAYSQYNSAMAS